MKIMRFFLLLLFLLISYSAAIEVYYFQKLKDQIAEIAFDHLEEDLLELTEDISILISDARNTNKIFKQMDWVVVNNQFVDEVVIQSPAGIIYTTNAKLNLPGSDAHLTLEQARIAPQKLFNENRILSHQTPVQTRNGSSSFRVSFKTNNQNYQALLAKRVETFILFFILLPFIGVVIFIAFLRRYIVLPLNRLESYVFKHDQALPHFLIGEFNSIYMSMKKAFSGLEQDRQRLFQQVRRDRLTGLPNRLALKEYLGIQVVQAQKSQSVFALLFLDFDNFKFINDSLGHDKGDDIVACAAEVLQSQLPSNGFIARVGGDEFVIVIPDYQSQKQLEALTQTLIDALLGLNDCCEAGTPVSCSIGVACYPTQGKNYIELMQKADIAMYEAKRQGKGRYHFYSPELNERVQKNIALDQSMRQALQNKEFVLYYQPKIDLKTKAVVGAEALIRWIKPDGEIISPADFIPIAELNGFIVQLGEWVLEAAFLQLQLWTKRMPDCVLSINVSARQLAEPGFCEYLKSLLVKYHLDPSKIDLEVTEYLFFDHSVDNLKTVNDIRAMGFSISLDDFGTGFSSLSYLKKFHVDQIKIDKSFIDDFDSESGAIFIETIVKMSESLKKQIIAEGVETASQAEYLQSVGCINVQGFFFSKPLPLPEFERYYQKHKPAVI